MVLLCGDSERYGAAQMWPLGQELRYRMTQDALGYKQFTSGQLLIHRPRGCPKPVWSHKENKQASKYIKHTIHIKFRYLARFTQRRGRRYVIQSMLSNKKKIIL